MNQPTQDKTPQETQHDADEPTEIEQKKSYESPELEWIGTINNSTRVPSA